MFRTFSSSVRQLLIVLATLVATSCSGGDYNPTSSTILPFTQFSQTDLRVGDGADATVGRGLSVHYTGWLYDPTKPEQKGQQFDTSAGGAPFSFTLGAGQVIPGWDRGVVGMKIGGQRRLVIPPNLAYGSAGAGGGRIPPNATLVFDIELIEVRE